MKTMTFDEMVVAIDEAKLIQARADSLIWKMAPLLVGRLRSAGGNTLAALKRELRDYNIHTGRWDK